ncbi:MAG: RNA-binding protein [Alphaproteobacteria bacterium]
MIAVPQAPHVKPECSGKAAVSSPDEPERRCIVTGVIRPREELIRCVIGPDGQVWPDLDAKLPGRGLWVGCAAGLVATAVRKNLFAKAARAPASCSPDLVARINSLLHERVLQLLGLAQRSGICVTGFTQVEPAVKSGEIALLFIAADAGQDGASKLQPRIAAENIYRFLSSPELGRALGYDQLVYAGLRPHALTQRIVTAATRFSTFSTQENIAPEPGLAQIDPEIQGQER